MNINKVQFAGKMTHAPELKKMPNGNSVVNFSLACNRKYKKEGGEVVEEVEFANCVIFGKQADVFNQYVIKGQTMYIEGRLKTRTWEDKNGGGKRYATEIIVEGFQFGEKPLSARTTTTTDSTPQVQPKGMDGIDYGEVNDYESIPF